MASKAPLEKFLGPPAKKVYPKKVQRGDFLDLQGVESLRVGRPPTPLNPLLAQNKLVLVDLVENIASMSRSTSQAPAIFRGSK